MFEKKKCTNLQLSVLSVSHSRNPSLMLKSCLSFRLQRAFQGSNIHWNGVLQNNHLSFIKNFYYIGDTNVFSSHQDGEVEELYRDSLGPAWLQCLLYWFIFLMGKYDFHILFFFSLSNIYLSLCLSAIAVLSSLTFIW